MSPLTLYSPGGKLVFCDMDSRKAGGCVPPNASLSWLINFVGFNIVVYSSVPGRAVCLSVSVPVWFRGRGGGWCSSLRPCYSSDVMGDAPWQGGCSEDDQASKIFYCCLLSQLIFYCCLLSQLIVFMGLVVWRVGFGSGRRLGFVSGASGSKKKSRHRNQERTQSAHNDADDDGGWTAARG